MDYNDEESEWYGCPGCGITWGQEYMEDLEDGDGPMETFRQLFPPREPNAEVLAAVEGEEFQIQNFPIGMHYPTKICPICRHDKGKPPEELLLDKNFADWMGFERVYKVVSSEATPITKEGIVKVRKKQLAHWMELDKLSSKSKEEEEEK